MNWHPPLSTYTDEAGTVWRVHRAWHDKKPGEYVLEVVTPGQPGVRGAHLSSGRFRLLPEDDPELPALRAEREHGEIIAYRPYMRAIIRADGRYIKIFRPGSAVVPAERCTQMDDLLDAGAFTAPEVLQSSPDTLVFKALSGPTLGEVGEDHVTVGEAAFAGMWAEWSDAWLAQLAAASDATRRKVLGTLPVHSSEAEAADVARWLKRWLRHTEDVPALASQREALRATAEHITTNLLGTEPDPLGWAHGDLHDRQIIARNARSPFGLLDFDDAAQSEAARDLANLDVHLELRVRRNSLTPARYVKAHTAVLAVAEQLQVSPRRLEAYSDASWLRLACSSLPSRSNLATAVLDERAQRQSFGSPVLTGSRPVGSRS
ncbi:aminoglycoside/choline kinase family phosphotransferase [Arthrobacter sp. V4I6]|uniref:phosphotransferase n=1 Tax=unclassified Arthrobacter TaxID=235627 RepID=UPI002780E33C|nr:MULTISPECIES: phosphotransferase [unclassified Arthrobacter]MDQ0819332.1 aminoglycoside/choline kinase family phosphotransferase [Arthrobacter sp. V1I7]MDQ0853515.1 aminoglycoside/choline kinase family phosphotransferase [Arthrobacter sp. V4I6]